MLCLDYMRFLFANSLYIIIIYMSIVNKIDREDHSYRQPSRSSSAYVTAHPPTRTPAKQLKDDSHDKKFHVKGLSTTSNPQKEVPNTSEATLKKLIEMNENYLIEKVKISDVPTPPKYSHKIPSKTGSSEYNRRFVSANRLFTLQDSTPQQDISGNILKLPNYNIASYESTYHKDFDSKQRPDSVTCKSKPKYEKNDGPNFNESSYHRDYGSVMQSPTLSAKRREVRLMGGGKLNDCTTYKQYYRLRTSQSVIVPEPIIHKDNRIFTKLQNPQISSYQSTFAGVNKKNKVKVQNCKPLQKYNPVLQNNKYKTEYSEVFVPQAIVKKKEFEWMSPAELKNYVMTILDN